MFWSPPKKAFFPGPTGGDFWADVLSDLLLLPLLHCNAVVVAMLLSLLRRRHCIVVAAAAVVAAMLLLLLQCC